MKKRFLELAIAGIMAVQCATTVFAAHNVIECENGNKIVNGVCYSADMKNLLAFTELYDGGKDFTVPDGVTKIDFSQAYTIDNIAFSDTVKELGSGAFSKSSVKNAKFGKKSELVSIDEKAFENSALESIWIPESVEEIADNAFVGCNRLKTVGIWESEYRDAEYDVNTVEVGDMNADGRISASDARMALRISAGLDEGDKFAMLLGDTDRNGRLSAADARTILRISAGLV